MLSSLLLDQLGPAFFFLRAWKMLQNPVMGSGISLYPRTTGR